MNDSDSECDKAFAALWPGIPFKLKEVLNPDKFNPLKFVKESWQKGVKLVNFTHSEQLRLRILKGEKVF